MKKMKLIRQGVILLSMFVINFTSCTKVKNEANSDTTSLQQLAKDQADVQSASEDGLNDANNVVTPGTTKSRWVPNNATVDTTISGDTTIYTITYNGNNRWNTRSRTGTIIVKRLTAIPWSQQGTTIWITFVNYKVNKGSTNKAVTLNGSKAEKNVSGGVIGDGTQVIHEVSGALQLTFDDNTTRTWNISRRRTFTGTLSQLVLTIDGFGSSAGYNNLETWGTNRKGELFYTQINQSVIRKISTCGLDPTSGIVKHSIPSDNKSATITYGYDSNDQPVSSTSTDCPVKYKLDWVKNGHSGTVYNYN